jgi:hypothetical protein
VPYDAPAGELSGRRTSIAPGRRAPAPVEAPGGQRRR